MTITTIIIFTAGFFIGAIAGMFAMALFHANKDPYDYFDFEPGKEVVYISGKMRGMDERESKHRFWVAEQMLKDKGYNVINPWKNPYEGHESWGELIIRDLAIIKRFADHLYMLDNWHLSSGAKTEHYFAEGNGISIFYQDEQDETL